jgi:hypothetical protein
MEPIRSAQEDLSWDETAKRSPAQLYDLARRNGRLYTRAQPRVGDSVFFSDGNHGAGVALVGLIERVEESGTMVLVAHVAQGTFRLRMNLRHPEARRDPNGTQIFNHYLIGGAHPKTTAQLWLAFARSPSPTAIKRLAKR